MELLVSTSRSLYISLLIISEVQDSGVPGRHSISEDHRFNKYSLLRSELIVFVEGKLPGWLGYSREVSRVKSTKGDSTLSCHANLSFVSKNRHSNMTFGAFSDEKEGEEVAYILLQIDEIRRPK